MSPGADPTTLSGGIVAAMSARGNATVARWKRYGLWQNVTGKAMADRIDAIARGLAASGFAAGNTAAIIGDNCLEWVLADLAIMQAGGVSAGLDVYDDADQLARAINACSASVLFVVGDDQLHKALAVRERCVSLKRIVVMHAQWEEGGDDGVTTPLDALERAGAQGQALPSRATGDAAAIISTSGVSAPSRGVIVPHETLIARCAEAAVMLRLSPVDTRVNLTPIHHVLERVVGIYASLLSGVMVHFPESRDTALANLVELQPTIVQAAPRLWARLRTQIELALADATPLQRRAWRLAQSLGPRSMLGSLVIGPVRQRLGLGGARLCLSSGAPLRPDVVAWFAAIGITITDIYGQAEWGGAIDLTTSADAMLSIANDGELVVNAPTPHLGYVDDAPVAPATTWRTGDIAVRDATGAVRVVGRVADAASKTELATDLFDRERVLRESPYVADTFLWRNGEGQLCAYVLLDGDSTIKYAQDRSIPFTHFQSLCRASEIADLVAALVASVNATPGPRIGRFELIERALGLGDPAVAPTLALRRYLLRGDDDRATVDTRDSAAAAQAQGADT